MNKRFFTALLLAILPFISGAQTYPRDYFTAPLDTPLVMTGSFGEIRENHFHTGIDLSTNDEEGLPVSAIADGYVSRIKVSADGYGKALYITHPNGYVSVYGHLQKFAGPLFEYVRKYQFEKQTYEFDIKPKEGEFRFRQRDVIAYSGSTGSAEEPHLHFEIRDEKTEDPINPLVFGYKIKDNIKPEIKNICIYPMRENGIVNTTDLPETYQVIQGEDFKYRLNTADYPQAYGNISFGIEAEDKADSTESVLGIYSAELFVDDRPVFTWKFDRLSFENNRDVNAHIDYAKKVRDHQTMERYFRLPGDMLNIYSSDSLLTGGVFFGQDASHDIKMIVRDFKGNTSEINFQIITYTTLSQNPYEPRPKDALLVSNAKGIAIHKSQLDVVIPEGSVYDDYYYSDEAKNSYKYESDIFRIGDFTVPLRQAITIGIKPNEEIPENLKSKVIIARLGEYDEIYPCGGQWNGKFLTAKTSYFGEYAIMLDTVPPKVEKYYVPAEMDGMYGGEVRIKIKDELSGIKSYSGKIDDRWYLFEYDKKSNMMIANIDALTMNLEHKLEITVTDERGNTNVWKSSFYF